jgi:hypothetical protein
MRNLFTLILCCCFGGLFGQSDSIRVFFYGNHDNGEKFKVFWDGKLIQTVKASDTYKYSFSIPRKNWTQGDIINELSIYRKGRLGLKWKEISHGLQYEDQKYIRIYRSRALKNWASVFVEWTDKEPENPPSSKI